VIRDAAQIVEDFHQAIAVSVLGSRLLAGQAHAAKPTAICQSPRISDGDAHFGGETCGVVLMQLHIGPAQIGIPLSTRS